MNSFARSFLFLLVLTASAAAAQPQIESSGPAGAAKSAEAALSMVPSDAIVVIALRSISAGVSSAATFVDAIEPGAAKSIESGIGRAIDGYGEGAGIDSSAPFVAALLPVDKGRSGMVMYLPLSDYEAWRENWKDSIQTDAASGTGYFEKWQGHRVYFKPVADDSYLAIADDAGTLAAASRQTAALPAERVSGIVAGLATAPLEINVSVASLAKAYPDLPDKITETIAHASMGGAQPAAGAAADSTDSNVQSARPPVNLIADAYGRMARSLLAGLDEMYFAVTPDAEALTVNARVTTVKGSHVEQVLSQQGSVDLSDLTLLPDKPLMAFVTGMKGDAIWADIKDIYARMIDAYAPDAQKAASERALLEKTFDTVKACGLTDNMAFSISGDSKDGALRAYGVYQTGEPQKALGALTEFLSDPDVLTTISRGSSVSGMSIDKITVSDETIDDTAVKVISEALTYSEGLQQRMFSSMFGSSIVTRVAARDSQMLSAMAPDGAAMKDLLGAVKGAPGRIDAAKVSASTEGFPPNLSGLALISAGDYILWSFRVAMPEAGASAGQSVPETKSFAAIGWSFTDGSATATLRVPTEQIRVASSTVKQLVQGTQQGPARTEEKSEGHDAAANEADLKRIGLAIGMYQYNNSGAMPESLDQLVDAGMLQKDVLYPEEAQKPEVESTRSEEEAEAAEGMGGIRYEYAPLSDPAAAKDPTAVPIAWDTLADSDNQVAVLWLDLHTSILSPDELSEAVDKNEDLYEETPIVPENASDESVESSDLEPGEVESPDMEAPDSESPDMESPEMESTGAGMARLGILISQG